MEVVPEWRGPSSQRTLDSAEAPRRTARGKEVRRTTLEVSCSVTMSSDAWLQINSEQGAARLLYKGLSAARGVGMGQLTINVELSSRKEIADGLPVWLTGTVQVKNIGSQGGHLGALRAQTQPTALPTRGGTRDISFTCDVTYPQLQVIEEHRTGPVSLFVDFSGHWFIKCSPVPFSNAQLDIEIKQSDWIAILEQTGYRRILLLEFEAPRLQESPTYATAFTFFADAQKHYLEHEWRLTVESLRQCLAALVGKCPDDDEDDGGPRAAAKDLRKTAVQGKVGYTERYELVRQALKFLSDLGAHPEVSETTRSDAHASLLMVAGLMQGLTRTKF